jgi:hypothetical protein
MRQHNPQFPYGFGFLKAHGLLVGVIGKPVKGNNSSGAVVFQADQQHFSQPISYDTSISMELWFWSGLEYDSEKRPRNLITDWLFQPDAYCCARIAPSTAYCVLREGGYMQMLTRSWYHCII